MNIERHSSRPRMPLSPTCNFKDCGLPSKWQVSFEIFARGFTKPHQAMRCELGMSICAEHGKTATLGDFLTDAGWAQILAAADAARKLPPAREHTKLVLLPILGLEG